MEEGRERPERESNFVFDAHSTSTVIYQGEERLRERERERDSGRERERLKERLKHRGRARFKRKEERSL